MGHIELGVVAATGYRLIFIVMSKLNILILHSLGNPGNAPSFLKHHVFSLKDNCPEHNYIYHDTSLPLPNYVRDTSFDAIILDVTLLCARWLPNFEQLKDSYSFVKESDAAKIALPQDEYDCNELLDEWMCDWRIDVVYSVISTNWDVLYPKYHKRGKIRLGYTGYVDETLSDVERKPFDQRAIDIGYRARKLAPYFGRIGEIKWTIGRDVAVASKSRGLTTDIILGENGTLYGKAWLDLLNKSKFTLGSNSGSSLLDPRGHLQKEVKMYLANHPNAGFDEVEEHCFKGLDGRYLFTAISPRVMEAALLDSCQILVKGKYSGIVAPWDHYIPIEHDASDFDDVFKAMHDKGLVERIIKNCREAVLDVNELRYSDRAEKLIELIGDLVTKKRTNSSVDAVKKICVQYEREMPTKYARHWQKQYVRKKLASIIDSNPAISRLIRSARSYFTGNV